MNLMNKFKERCYGTCLPRIWHCCVPPITLTKRYFDLPVCMDLRDNIDDLTRSTHGLMNREKLVLSVLDHVKGLVWDVGANVGLFSVAAVLRNHPCVAFEFSPKACSLMRMTKDKNKLSFEIVNKAFTVKEQRYSVPTSSNAENRLLSDPDGEMTSYTYLDAEKTYGIPTLIKMDIEGGEGEFFKSPDFKNWIVENGVVWLVEVHSQIMNCTPVWEDVPYCLLSQNHYLYCANSKILHNLESKLRRDIVG